MTPAGIEPAATGVKVRYLNQFDHGAMVPTGAFGTPTCGFSGHCSTSELRGHMKASVYPQMHGFGGPGRTRTFDVSNVPDLQSGAFATGLPTHIVPPAWGGIVFDWG